MDYAAWLELSEAERVRLMRDWNGYEDGYWHALVAAAAADLAGELKDKPWVINVHHAVHHGGSLVIGVVTTFRPGESTPELPTIYAGFPVLPFLRGREPSA